MSDYATRCIRQSLRWVNGKPEHNYVDDECTPDFSCCELRCFTESLERRIERNERLIKDLGERRRNNNSLT